VSGRTIRLRDVAESATGALADVTLGASALPGRSCTLTAGEIRLRVRAARLDPGVLSLPPVITVRTAAGPLTPNKGGTGGGGAGKGGAATSGSPSGSPIIGGGGGQTGGARWRRPRPTPSAKCCPGPPRT